MPVTDRYEHPAIYITLACVSVVTLVVLSLLILQYLKYGCEACLNACKTSEQKNTPEKGGYSPLQTETRKKKISLQVDPKKMRPQRVSTSGPAPDLTSVKQLEQVQRQKKMSLQLMGMERYKKGSFRIPYSYSFDAVQPPDTLHCPQDPNLSDVFQEDTVQPLLKDMHLRDDCCSLSSVDGGPTPASSPIHPRVTPGSPVLKRVSPVSPLPHRARTSSRPRSGTGLHESWTLPDATSDIYKHRNSVFWHGNDSLNSDLGEAMFTLQYRDREPNNQKYSSVENILDKQCNKNLIVTLKSIKGMKLKVADALIYVTVVLAPDREYVHTSKKVSLSDEIVFDAQFSFAPKQYTHDFESRSVLVTIHCEEKNGKEFNFGEVRMALLTREIYSQVPTDVKLPIFHFRENYNEIGDAHIMLSIEKEKRKLTVLVNIIKIPAQQYLKDFKGIHIRGWITNNFGTRYGKKKSINSKLATIQHHTDLIEFVEQMSFKFPDDKNCKSPDDANKAEQSWKLGLDHPHWKLKLNLHGKHRLYGKHILLGKIRIGDELQRGSGHIHWKRIFNTPDIGWAMWQPIYQR